MSFDNHLQAVMRSERAGRRSRCRLLETKSISIFAKQQLMQAGIELHITKKRVKNINFRLKPHPILVSVPLSISTAQIAQAVVKRVSWAVANHAQVLEQYKRKQLAAQETP